MLHAKQVIIASSVVQCKLHIQLCLAAAFCINCITGCTLHKLSVVSFEVISQHIRDAIAAAVSVLKLCY